MRIDMLRGKGNAVNLTQAQYDELCLRSGAIAKPADGKRVGILKPKRPEPVSGPLSVLLVLHGHCPSKKNGYGVGAGGHSVVLPAEMRKQIETLTLQAMFQWKLGAPVEHADLTFQFFVHQARRDRDGILVTVLDCLQAAGVLVNDNLKRSNGRMVLEPAIFVPDGQERVDVLVVKQ